MTSTVFANAQLAHVWAQQSQPEGRSNNGNFYFEGSTLYSYGRHFIVGRFIERDGRRAVILNSDRYSTSTTQHQSYARSAVHGLGLPVFETPGAGLDHEANLQGMIEAAGKARLRGDRTKKEWSKGYEYERAVKLLETANEYAVFFGLEFSPPDIAAVAEYAKALAAQRKSEEKRRREEARAKAKADFEAWLRGEAHYAPVAYREDEHGGAYLRVFGDELQTSRGARVPLAHAVKAFRFIKLVKARGEPGTRNGRLVRVGHFTVDRIEASGHIRAGCHFIRWPEIERVARQVGVFEEAPSAEAEEHA